MSSLLVYKASAGSGKTFTLAVEYIKLLIQNPTAYRHILAVTFTNKATGEMKERILSQLYGIAKGDSGSKAYLDKICAELEMSPEVVRKKAGEALTWMIHDYSRFQVTTIDSFFQMVMRNLARELGLGASMNIELDTTGTLDNAVDKMIEQLDEHSPVFNHLLQYIEELIKEDKSWKIIDSIKDFARDIFREEFMERRTILHDKLSSQDFIPTYKKLLEGLRKKTEAPLQETVDSFFQQLKKKGLDYTVFKGGAKGIGSYFKKLQEKNYSDKIRNATVEKCLLDINEWRTAKSHDALKDDAFLTDMQALLIKAEKLRKAAVPVINSCKLSLEHINKVSLLAAIDDEVHEQNRRKNIFLLAETNILLRQLIDDNDSSFVFEKIGANIRHVMIDEFQDTSRLQWKNFQMLLVEGLSQGADSLIVGDVKQAIYRWRSGDWGILNGLRGSIRNYPVEEKSLTTNRRSEEVVIRFNNDFFTAAVQELNKRHQDDQKEDCAPLISAYSDVSQAFPEGKEGGKGYVKINFADENDGQTYEEATLQSLADEVERLISEGVHADDIAILVRKNRFIPLIADYFKTALPSVNVVSNEAYRMDASMALNTLIQALRVLARPNDLIARAHLAILCHTEETPFRWDSLNADRLDEHLPNAFLDNLKELRRLPLYELMERLVNIFALHQKPGEEAYLLPFFDAVTEYLKNHTADYDNFLRYWDDKLCGKTIPSGDINGLRIYSIHNSKGLEFHTVIVPFCNWKMENERPMQTVWCNTSQEPYNHIDLLPIRYGSEMNNSVYKDTYLKERLELWVDNLNILYVAFTRATANLVVLGKKKEKDFGVSSLMQATLKRINPEYNAETPFERGAVLPHIEREERQVTNLLVQRPTNIPVRFESYNRPLEFRQSNRSAAFIRGDEYEENSSEKYLRQGRLLHRIFSEIATAEDVSPLMQQMEMEGLFGSTLNSSNVKRIVERALGHPQGGEWFNGKWRLFNEQAIIFKKGDETVLRRPDRVMLSPDEGKIVVVDFKFGTARPEYLTQVSEYMQLLRQMGYSEVEGYLWYVYKGKIEKIEFES
ncbi:MAG: UvrD-helicase domain-containing protein [Bacteroidaceae bacterium]|nr:UvrD-helicase domain-containing protein [Bacteroidaceae bacterium]